MTKSEQLQLRITADQKALIKERAALAGEDVSKWVLRKLLPTEADEFQRLVNELGSDPQDYSLALADIHDFLQRLSRKALEVSVRATDLGGLDLFLSNYVAAMIEQACAKKGAQNPGWIRSIPPLPLPWFASELKSLRLYLLTNSPVPFRRRNLFVDSTLGDRV